MPGDGAARGTARLMRLAVRASTAWALAGGAVLCAVIAVNVVSILGAALGAGAVPGDFELTELGVAVAVFAFLPYCRATGRDVRAEVFASRASDRARAAMDLLAATVAALFAALLFWRMWAGMADQREYGYVTTILQIPVWWGYAASLASLALLIFAAAATWADALARLRER